MGAADASINAPLEHLVLGRGACKRLIVGCAVESSQGPLYRAVADRSLEL
ncbi:MAG: hypothetical protein OHK0022_38460 [Roseiflexaceae bacterium]